MTVRKAGNKWQTAHCHGEDKGKTIASFDTKAQALAQHKAIMASKIRATKKKKTKRTF